MSQRLVDANDIIEMKECSLELQDKINELPSAYTDEVLRGQMLFNNPGGVEGSWHKISPVLENFNKCSRCGAVVSGMVPNFCPNCGADMRKAENEKSEV